MKELNIIEYIKWYEKSIGIARRITTDNDYARVVLADLLRRYQWPRYPKQHMRNTKQDDTKK